MPCLAGPDAPSWLQQGTTYYDPGQALLTVDALKVALW